jgi:hypothetical protein
MSQSLCSFLMHQAKLKMPKMETVWSAWQKGKNYVFCTSSFFCKPVKVITGDSRLPGDEYTRESWLHGVKYTGEFSGSLVSPVVNTPGSRLRIRILYCNSSNIRRSSKSFLCLVYGARRSCYEKTSIKIYRDTVLLRGTDSNAKIYCNWFQIFKFVQIFANIIPTSDSSAWATS